jgi:hypothetical protein
MWQGPRAGGGSDSFQRESDSFEPFRDGHVWSPDLGFLLKAIDIIESLPEDDDWPRFTRTMFSITSTEYETPGFYKVQMIHFGALKAGRESALLMKLDAGDGERKNPDRHRTNAWAKPRLRAESDCEGREYDREGLVNKSNSPR